jgi:hypothetical protein
MASLQDVLRGQLSPELITELENVLNEQEHNQRTEVVAAPGALDPDVRYTDLQVDGTDAFTLADGTFIGAIKEIWCSAATTTPAGTLTPDNLSGLTTIDFDAVDEYVKLIWDGTNWVVAVNQGATLA